MSWSCLLPALLASAAAGLVKEPVPLPPQRVSWDGLQAAGFDPAWRLGAVLPQAKGSAGQPRFDLAEAVERLARLETGVGPARTTFGDVLAGASEARRDERANAAWIAEARARHAWFFEQAGLDLEQLLDAWRVKRSDWDPGWDAPDDGLLHADALSLASARSAPWNGIDDAPRVQQAAALVFATPADVLAVAHDFPGYLGHVSHDYRAIAPHPGSHWRGLDDEGRDFAAVLLGVSCRLPFPFGGYEMDLWVLDQVQADGDVVTSVYTRSPDFHWLAGRDLLVPVLDARGRVVATLAVRQQGFDLAGVPEDDDIRRSALRAGLGNLRRRAEARADRAAASPDELPLPQPLALPDFEVLASS